MFSFPVTVPVRTNESIFPMDVMVQIDDILFVKPLLDKSDQTGVDCASQSDSLIPLTEITFGDGRKLPVLETPATIDVYLNAYRSLDEFYSRPPVPMEEVVERIGGVVVPLFKGDTCGISGASTPD